MPKTNLYQYYEGWGFILEKYQKGNPLPRERVSDLLRRQVQIPESIKPEVFRMLADEVENRVKRKRGPKKDNSARSQLRELAVHAVYNTYRQEYSHLDARAFTADDVGLSEDQVDHAIYPRTK